MIGYVICITYHNLSDKILGVDILGVDILGVDILGRTRSSNGHALIR